MISCEPYTLNAFVVLCYDYNEYNEPILIDEYWCNSFDDALNLVSFSWEYPFEICQFVAFDKESRTSYKCVARSKEMAVFGF